MLRFSFAMLIGATLALPLSAQDTGVIHSTTWSWDDIAPPSGSDKSAAKSVVRRPTPTLEELEMHVTRLPPGQTTHPPHTHPNEELIIVREGTVEAFQEGRKTRLGPGSIIFEASNESHNLTNVGEVPAVYHVINWKTAATKPKAVTALEAEDAIRAFYSEASQTRNADAQAAWFAADAVLMPPLAAPIAGRAAIREWQERSAREASYRIVSERIEQDEIHVTGDSAICRSTARGEHVAKAGGPPTPFESTYFDVLRRKADGDWELTHRMWSSDRPAGRPNGLKLAESR